MNFKKISLFLIVCVLFISGCSENTSKEIIEEKQKSKEELIWEDADKDEIYNQRITIYDSVMIHAKYPDASFDDDIKMLTQIRNKNLFADEFLNLLEKTNIQETIKNGNDLEKYLLLSYLCIETNHNEGLGHYYNWVSDYKMVNDSYKLEKVYYRDESFASDRSFIEASLHSYLPYYVFEFVDESNSSKFVMSLGYVSSSGPDYTNISLNDKYKSIDQAKDKSTALTKITWKELDNDTVEKIINSNTEFLNFYIKYKDMYYDKFDKEHDIRGQYSSSDKETKKDPKVGMTKSEVLSSTWGSPKKKEYY